MKLNILLLRTILAMFVINATAQVPPTNGLVAYYKFDGTLTDSTTNGHDGLAIGQISYVPDRFSLSNSAVHLAGGQYLNISPTPFDVNSDYTISFWVKMDFDNNAVNNFFSTGSDGAAGFNIRNIPNTALGWTFIPQGVQGVVSKDPTNYYTWNAVVCTRQGSNIFLYVDGELKASGNYAGSVADSGSLWLGKHQNSFSYDMAGALDDIRIYNRAFSTNEVSQLYASEAPHPAPHAAQGVAIVTNGFIIGVTITDPGFGYTNTPLVRFIGGGGSDAQATATVSNESVTNIVMVNAGGGYTNLPQVVIEPPFISQPNLSIAPISLLVFSNLTIGTNYQLQSFQGWYWTNLQPSFEAASSTFNQVVSGQNNATGFRLALSPAPLQAFASPELVNGFLVGATITSAGSGYVSNSLLNIVGGGGSNAVAMVEVGNGMVTNIQILNAGVGYTGTPILEIAPPPVTALTPISQSGVRINSSPLAPYDNYQFQFKADLAQPWQDFSAVFLPTDLTNSQYLFITNSVGFFRLKYLP